MPPSKDLAEEHILPFKMTVVGEEDASEDWFPDERSKHAHEVVLEMWKVVPPKPTDAVPKPNRLLVEWPTQNTEHSFHHFPRLPKELRLQIWEELLPEPRIVQFHLTGDMKLDPTLSGGILRAGPDTFKQDQLLACSESRAVYKKAYRRIVISKVPRMAIDRYGHELDCTQVVTCTSEFGLESFTEWWLGSTRAPSHFDCRRDTLMIGWSDMLSVERVGARLNFSWVENIAFHWPYDQMEAHAVLFKKTSRCIWRHLIGDIFPDMKAFTLVVSKTSIEIDCHTNTDQVPRLLELTSELNLITYDESSSDMRSEMEAQLRKASAIRELFFEQYRDSVIFKVARMYFECLYERRYYEVIDLEPADGTTVDRDTNYFTRRPIVTCYGKDLHVYFGDHCLTLHCTAGGDLLSPYDEIERLFRERTLQEREEEERQRGMNWTCCGGKVVLDQSL